MRDTGWSILDHCYSNFHNSHKALPRPVFGKSDHDSILLLSTYRQKLKQETPMLKSVQRWSDQSDSTLQDCFDHMDWEMFQIASDNNIDVYADLVSEFISKCIEMSYPLLKSFLTRNRGLIVAFAQN
jgi:hypothetical protein